VQHAHTSPGKHVAAKHWWAASSLLPAHPDPSGLGILTEITLGAHGGDFHICGVYFSCPNLVGSPPTNRLRDKTQSRIGSIGISHSPQAYHLDQLGARSPRHQGNGATATPPRCNTTIIAGEINAAWDGRHGPLTSLGYRAATASLISATAAQSTSADLLYSYYRGGSHLPHLAHKGMPWRRTLGRSLHCLLLRVSLGPSTSHPRPQPSGAPSTRMPNHSPSPPAP